MDIDMNTNYTISLKELVDDIYKLADDETAYTFLKVLDNKDVILLLAYLNEDDYTEIYNRKKIKLSRWLYLMKKCEPRLNYSYIVYRKAYFGENRGNEIISNVLTNYVVSYNYFITDKDNADTHSIWCCFGKPNPIKRILLNNNKMELIDFNKAGNIYRKSGWSNWNYKVNEDEWY